jgi:hypothetical protein
MKTENPVDFHAHHSPLGAYATFTCGRFGAGGGMTILGAKPAADELAGKAKDWAMCDQCVNGEGRGSKYYPRCVTADLWLGVPPVERERP